MTGPAPYFRGSELPRLLVLLGILAVGWPLVIWSLVRDRDAPTRVDGREAAPAPPLPPPDDAPEFRGIADRESLTARDTAAYAALLRRVRETPPGDLARRARRDVVFSQLWDDPARYRGLPIHIEGTARRVLRQEVADSQVFEDGTYYEAYVFTPDSQRFPWAIAFEEPPAGLEVGDNLVQPVSFDGYFLKLMAYEAGDVRRAAPLLVGRFTPSSRPAPPADRPGAPWGIPWPILIIGALTIYLMIRLALQFRARLSPRPAARPPLSARDEPEPGLLSDWLERAEEGDLDDDPDRDILNP